MKRKYSNNERSSTKISIYIILVLTVAGIIIFISGCVQPTEPPEKPSPTQISTKEPSILIIESISNERCTFIKKQVSNYEFAIQLGLYSG